MSGRRGGIVASIVTALGAFAGVGAPLTAAAAPLVSDPAELLAAEREWAAIVAERPRHPACQTVSTASTPRSSAIRDDRCREPIGSVSRSTPHPGVSDLAEQAVMTQQRHLNRLFEGYGIAPLDLDGDPGPVTRQRLCAFRFATGLPVSTDAMAPGSDEEATLFATTELAIPDSSATTTSRWILIEQRCQIMFVGAGADHLQFVFPTSTGKQPFPTRFQDRTRAYRYNPASHNGGWHDSLTYPAASDNPRNGNMYRPLYFDGGQAIHGANSVPRSPASHGCARLRTWHQDDLLAWLGLADAGPTRSRDRINVTVTVQGSWQG